MISLKKSIDVLEGLERRGQTLARAYADLLKVCEQTANLLAHEGEGSELSKRLREARAEVAESSTVRVQQGGPADVGESYLNLVKRVDREWRAKEAEYKRIVVMVTEAAEASYSIGSRRSRELHTFANQLDSVSSVDDVLEVRRRLAKHVADLRTAANSIEVEAQRQSEQMKHQLELVQMRLQSAEEAASQDSLTGLSNRRHAEFALDEAIALGRSVCLIMIDLDDFKQINDRFGHSQGDELLRLFAADLRQCVRVGDVVSRWGGDEFLIILFDAGQKIASDVAARIGKDAFGATVLSRQGRRFCVELKGSLGIAEHIHGETAEQLFERADQLMYVQKLDHRSGRIPRHVETDRGQQISVR